MVTARLAPAFALLAFLLAGCDGAGPYGHSPRYAALDDETRAAAGAREYDPVMAARQPEQWRQGTVSLFGRVESRSAGPGGSALLKLSIRRLETRNLCGSESDEDSCRVTVSDRDFGSLWALVALHGGDDVGPHSVAPGSLLRVVGTLGQEVSPADGGAVIHASWYRHWPLFYYVTRASARDLRQ